MRNQESHSRVTRRPLHGVLLLDKPLGLSSNQALQRCKWLLRAEKAGHTGTLDPLATGVLPLCFGAATKFSQLQLDADKTYEATLQLGVRTSTGDAEGEVIAQRAVPPISPERLAQVTRQFTGPMRQVPPMHSALKKDGKALYEYARAGEEVDRAPREILVHALHLSLAAQEHTLLLRAKVSKGTYIRTLGEDIGEALGCGAHLRSLRRHATGQFDVTQCITLDALAALGEEERLDHLLPVEALVADHTAIGLDTENAARFLTGLRRRGDWQDNDRVAVFAASPGGGGGSCLLGTAHIKGGELIPGRLLSPPEISQILETMT